jgi:hypothetical protein
MAKIEDAMVESFQVEPLERLENLTARGPAALRSEFLVLTTHGQPLWLVPSIQLGTFLVERPRLPVVPMVRVETDLEEAVRTLAPQLLDWPDLAGAVVLLNSEIRGVLPRSLIALQAGNLLGTRSYGLPGGPQVPPPTYACPRGDYQEEVIYYDPYNPPLCPVHREVLLRTA